jgi:hypothetical protein
MAPSRITTLPDRRSRARGSRVGMAYRTIPTAMARNAAPAKGRIQAFGAGPEEERRRRAIITSPAANPTMLLRQFRSIEPN